MEFQVSVADPRDPAGGTESDYLVTAGPGHRVGDLSAALGAALAPGRRAGYPASGNARDLSPLYLDGTPLDPGIPLSGSGIRAGARIGLGGPLPGPGQHRVQRQGTGAAELHVVSGPDAGLAAPLFPGELIIGRHGQFTLGNTRVSRQHCVLAVAPDGAQFTLRDLGSENGTGINGERIGTSPVPVHPGQFINVGKDVLTITAPGGDRGISLRADPANPFGLLVNRRMRTSPALPSPVAIDLGGDDGQRRDGTQWANMLIGPVASVAISVVIGAVMHQWMFLLLGLAGTVATLAPQLLNWRGTSRRGQAGKRELAAAAQAAQARLAAAITAEEQARRSMLPDPAALARIATEPGARLWERTPAEEDFLRLRFGTADLPSATITTRGGHQQGGDPATAPEAGGEPARPIVADVPVSADLATLGVLGIAGPQQSSMPALAWAVAQLAVLHAPGELRLVLLTEAPRAWRWTRWLPQLRPLDDATGWLNVGTDQASRAKRVTELCQLISARLAAGHGAAASGGWGHAGGGRGGQLPHVVVVIDGSAGVQDISGIEQVLNTGPAAGVSVIVGDRDARDLPLACAARLDTGPEAGGAGSYTERASGVTVPVRRLDTVTPEWADEVARALAPLAERSAEQVTTAADAVRLNDLWDYRRLDAATVEGLWQRTGGQRTAVPLGRMPDGSPFFLDIAGQGPNMLVGGSPGSGKSEFLQAFVASLALGNTPEALTFVLIDYKGGTAFQGCLDLPHVTGFLSDLDEHMGSRVLSALRAETKHRERLLTKARCKDIVAYRAAGEPLGPLPRLVVVADEFAVLAQELPDVLKQITNLTRLGRALGMHLVLATQRPAGVVNADITSNTSLRVCLRVEDPADSATVIDMPDAASIGKQQVGRGYARFERSAVSQFQGAYVGGPAGDGTAVGSAALTATARPFETAGLVAAAQDPLGPAASQRASYTGPTDLSELVKAVLATGRQPPSHRAWLDPLPPLIPLATLQPPAGRGDAGRGGPHPPPIPYGMTDLPGEQCQEPLALDLEKGSNLLIGGAAQSGRTTALRTIAAGIAAGCDPADVHLYALDCNSGVLGSLEQLPHCGAVVRHTDAQRAGRLLDRLEGELSRRRDLLTADGFSSVTEQRAQAPAARRLPYLVLLLDGWETFSAELGQLDSDRLAGVLARLLAGGASAGLRVIVTGGLAALNKLGSSCPQRIVLRLSGPNDLHSANVPRGAMPADPSPGRGVLLPAGAEVQLAFAGTDPSGAAQTTAMNEVIATARRASPAAATAPLRVDTLPHQAALAQATALPGWTGRQPLQAAVAIGGDELGWLGPDLSRVPGFAVAGPFQSGKSTALVVLAESLLAAGTSVIGLAPRESPLRGLAPRDGVLGMFTDERPDPHKIKELILGAPGPLVVLADDADALIGQPELEGLLSGLLDKGRDRGWGLAAASTAAQFGRLTQNLLTTMRDRYRSGLLLTPEDLQQPLLFGARLPRSAVFDKPAGRGFLIQAGQAVLGQVPGVQG